MPPVLPAPFLHDLPLSALLGVVKRLNLTFHLPLLACHAPFFLADRQLLANLLGTQSGVVFALIHRAMLSWLPGDRIRECPQLRS
jgi:hypothetical protein